MKRKKTWRLLGVITALALVAAFARIPQARAGDFDEFSLRLSTIKTSQSSPDVDMLVKVSGTSTATEDGVNVTFDTGFSVSNATVSTANLTSWDAECTNAWPSIAFSSVNGQTMIFTGGDLDPALTYCFIITSGIGTPSTAGNYLITVTTRAGGSDVDTYSMSMPIVDDDTITINADVAAYVTCDVADESGNSTINLGTLEYGTVTTTKDSSDELYITGGTNAPEGMAWYYRNSDSNVGLYNPSYLLDAPTSEDTISPTTVDCTTSDPCYGIYYKSGSGSSSTGTFVPDSDFDGLTDTSAAGPMTDALYGEMIGHSNNAPISNAVAYYNINATASQQANIGNYTDVLVFTCAANI